jgi:hypothetical protein
MSDLSRASHSPGRSSRRTARRAAAQFLAQSQQLTCRGLLSMYLWMKLTGIGSRNLLCVDEAALVAAAIPWIRSESLRDPTT